MQQPHCQARGLSIQLRKHHCTLLSCLQVAHLALGRPSGGAIDRSNFQARESEGSPCLDLGTLCCLMLRGLLQDLESLAASLQALPASEHASAVLQTCTYRPAMFEQLTRALLGIEAAQQACTGNLQDSVSLRIHHLQQFPLHPVLRSLLVSSQSVRLLWLLSSICLLSMRIQLITCISSICNVACCADCGAINNQTISCCRHQQQMLS